MEEEDEDEEEFTTRTFREAPPPPPRALLETPARHQSRNIFWSDSGTFLVRLRQLLVPTSDPGNFFVPTSAHFLSDFGTFFGTDFGTFPNIPEHSRTSRDSRVGYVALGTDLLPIQFVNSNFFHSEFSKHPTSVLPVCLIPCPSRINPPLLLHFSTRWSRG